MRGPYALLEQPVRLQVQCSRSVTSEALVAKEVEFQAVTCYGAVLVSACISLGEKQIARAALDAGLPLVVLL